MAWVDYLDVMEALLGDAATGGESSVVTAAVRDAGQVDGQTGRDVEVWGTAPVVYVPAPPSKDGKCQALSTIVGGTKVIVATRDTRAAAAVGDLPPGAAAFCCPTGKNAAVFKPDGSISLLQQGTDADALISIEADGAIILRNKWGQVQLDKDGFSVMLTTGECFSLSAALAQILAPVVTLESGVTKLSASAAAPLTAASLAAKPPLNVLI